MSRRGKYLWVSLDGDEALLAHLGMSGQLLVQPPGTPDEKHLRIRFSFADGGPELRFAQSWRTARSVGRFSRADR